MMSHRASPRQVRAKTTEKAAGASCASHGCKTYGNARGRQPARKPAPAPACAMNTDNDITNGVPTNVRCGPPRSTAFEQCLELMASTEAEINAVGMVTEWIDLQPVRDGSFEAFALLAPPPDHGRVISLCIPGLMQIKILDDLRSAGRWPAQLVAIDHEVERSRPILMALGIVTAGPQYDFGAEFLVASRAVPAATRKAVAALLRLCAGDRTNLAALLDGSAGCSLCQSPLATPLAKRLGFCRVCAKDLGVPFNNRMLAAVAVRRQYFHQPKGAAEHVH